MRRRLELVALALLALLLARPARAANECCIDPSSYKRVLSFDRIDSATNFCSVEVVRPNVGTPSASCVHYPTDAMMGWARAVWWTAEGAIATTSTKDPAITAGGSTLLYTRDRSTGGPPSSSANCPDGPNVAENSGCFPNCVCLSTLDNQFTAPTCLEPSGSAPARGVLNGQTLAARRLAVNAASAGRGGARPKHILVMRWDLLTPEEMQLAGFDPAFLAQPSPTTKLSDFVAWLASDTSPVCATQASDCTGSNKYGTRGKDQVPNGICIDGAGPKVCVPNPANGLGANLGAACTTLGECEDASHNGTCAGYFSAENLAHGACTWSDSENGSSISYHYLPDGSWPGWDGKDVGLRYRDLIAARGGDPDNVIYYLTRPSSSHFAPYGVVTRQDHSGYQDWRVGLVKRLVAESGMDYVELNQKLFQYDPALSEGYFVRSLVSKYDGGLRQCVAGPSAGAWCDADGDCPSSSCGAKVSAATCSGGGGSCTTARCVGGTYAGRACTNGAVDVSEIVVANDGGFSGDQFGGGYHMAQWAAGWRAIATKLHAAGLKYHELAAPQVFSASRTYLDDPSTPGINENDTLRSVYYDADLVTMTGADTGSDAPGQGCVGGETGAALTECAAGCRGKTESYLLRCVLAARGTTVLEWGDQTYSTATCPDGF